MCAYLRRPILTYCSRILPLTEQFYDFMKGVNFGNMYSSCGHRARQMGNKVILDCAKIGAEPPGEFGSQ